MDNTERGSFRHDTVEVKGQKGHILNPVITDDHVDAEMWAEIVFQDEQIRSQRTRELNGNKKRFANRVNHLRQRKTKVSRFEAMSDYFAHVEEVDIKYYWAIGAGPIFNLWRIKWKLFEGPAICMVVFAYFRYITYEDIRFFAKMNMFPGKKPRSYYIRSLLLKGHVQKVKVPSRKGNHPRTIFVLTPLGADAIADYQDMIDQTIKYLTIGKKRDEKTRPKRAK